MVIDLQFHGETYGWEARILEADGGWLSHSRGRFQTRGLAVQWAEQERIALSKPQGGAPGGEVRPLRSGDR